MHKVLYISIFCKTNESLLSDGVMKKINLHINCLEQLGCEVDYVYNDGENIFFHNNKKDIFLSEMKYKGYKYFNDLMHQTKLFIKKHNLDYDFVYIRYVSFSPKGMNALKYISKHSNCIYLEFPTFVIPERSLKNNIKNFFNKYLHKYVYKAVVDSLDNEAFGMPTLRIINGTDLKQIVPRKPTDSNSINVLVVAFLQKYHGVDKIINSTRDYYANGGQRDVVFHIVGEGPVYSELVNQCKQYNLDNHIIFYGKLHGKEMFDVFDKCEIGISSLANKEIGVTCSSTLKSKEYLAKGLPILSDTMLDVFVNQDKYFFHILENDFSIDELISFYDSVYSKKDKQSIINDIRAFAEQTCDMYKVFSEVYYDYLSYKSK